MNYLKKWWESQRNKAIKQNIKRLDQDFKVVEKEGKIWLTHLGFAFKEMPANKSAQEVAKELNKARQTAIEFEGWSCTQIKESKHEAEAL